mmetsp:Transcript_110206/g.351253  ORF Transcript_110206/g.351253 Transcript_110206/m.351253 type:complete len:134 (+) Transcript_110206:605-1006(+)
MDLRGLGQLLESSLPNLQELRVLDCNLSGADARGLLAQCPRLKEVDLCGNTLGGGAESDDRPRSAVAWPRMRHIRRADFRHCSLEAEDEDALRAALPAGAVAEFRVSLASSSSGAGGGGGGQHVMFDDSSDEE